MGTIIRSIAINKSAGQEGGVDLISKAAKSCFRNVNVNIEDIGMLISTGVYSENHLKEPALASLVQNQLIKNGCQRKKRRKETGNLFSFDVHNGGGGILNAIQIVDGFIQSNEIKYGLIVSGDIKPKKGITINYHYTTAAAAILLSKSNSEDGFIKYGTKTFPEFKDDFESTINWETGAFKFVNNQINNYLSRTVDCVIKAIRSFIEMEDLSWEEIDLILTSHSPKGFENELQQKLKVGNKIVQLNENGEIYSSGLLFALNQVIESNQFGKVRNILFVTVGAGITVSLALYKNKL